MTRLLLAVSGGADSMYLAHRAPEFYPGASFVVAHCNFSLRGAESDGDEEFVRAYCRENGLELRSTRFDTSGYAAANGLSTEMAARDLRYGWFSQLCLEEGCEAVAVAHNANDNAETMMLNLLRGTGSRGLRGMSGRSVRENGLVILRPMLGITREEIVLWMNARGFGWREDSTNAESVARRNILRNEVFPLLKKVNPAFLSTLREDMEHLRRTDDIAEDYFRSCGLAECTDEIPIDRLLGLRHWKYVLWRLLERCHLSAPTFGKLTSLLEKYSSSPSGTVTVGGKTFESPTHVVRIHRKKMLVVRRPD